MNSEFPPGFNKVLLQMLLRELRREVKVCYGLETVWETEEKQKS